MSGSFVVVALVVILAFGVLVFVHELGHYLAARASGMRVERFSIGFGPVIFATKRGETEWAVSAIPFGGYVRIAGMSPEEQVRPDDASAYSNQPAWRRFSVILAGPAMNYITAVLLAFAMIATLGIQEPDPRAAIGQVVPESAAAQAGLLPGDRVVAVEGAPVETWPELVSAVVASPGRPLRLSVIRGEASAPVEVVVVPRDVGGRGQLGVAPAMRDLRAGPAQAAATAVRLTNQRAWESLSGLGQVITGKQRGELMGPVGIAQEMARSARAGASQFLTMVWFISIVLAMFNLLPLPALDGGRLVFLGYEIVTRRRVNQRVESFLHMAGFVAIFGLILAVTVFGDLARILRR
jgi:regulator of sigma E protease